jgi:hypothetical protein
MRALKNATGEGIVMLEKPENVAKVKAIIDEIDHAHAEFSLLRDEWKTLESHRDTLLKSAQAAEEEAGQVREEMKAIMHATLGKPDKALLGKQANHRSAIEMAADYQALADEAAEEAIALRVKMSEPAHRLESLRKRLSTTFARLVLEEAICGIMPSLKIAYDAARMKYNDPEFLPAARHALYTHKEVVDEILGKAIMDAFDTFKSTPVQVELPDYILNALRKHSRGFIPFTPAQIVMRKKGNKAAHRAFQQTAAREAYPL